MIAIRCNSNHARDRLKIQLGGELPQCYFDPTAHKRNRGIYKLSAIDAEQALKIPSITLYRGGGLCPCYD